MSAPETNQAVASLFRSIAELLAAQRANPYRVRAYRRAADSLLALDEDINTIAARQALHEIEGIGTDLSEKILEYLRTGGIQMHESLKTPLPDHIRDWTQLPGLTISLVSYLYARLGITTLESLEQLVRSHMLRTVPGFTGGEEELLRAIATLKERASAKQAEAP
ncbi:putative DNA polymerase IV, family X [Nitrospira sp. KM1]|uniref:histidinol-phosphatase n=1 Tax=Nitrospira sp. KM1 TaxID=1936990 RepID=UPI0013A71CF0|nr:histidinol-phosphatase [Nitrospira sp. KM1]BCA54282.1 putative DNA polymerase IV, family X [Nitrospira sp. KM1]